MSNYFCAIPWYHKSSVNTRFWWKNWLMVKRIWNNFWMLQKSKLKREIIKKELDKEKSKVILAINELNVERELHSATKKALKYANLPAWTKLQRWAEEIKWHPMKKLRKTHIRLYLIMEIWKYCLDKSLDVIRSTCIVTFFLQMLSLYSLRIFFITCNIRNYFDVI